MMKDKQDIDDLFSMFHDFEIVEVEFNKPHLLMKIRMPWVQLWEDLDYQITVSISGCDFMECRYWMGNSSKTLYTYNPKIIESLEAEIQRHKFTAPNIYEFICNGSNCAGAEIAFTADSIELFDKSGKTLTLDKMKEWAINWWDSIQQMWDKRKEDKKNNC